MAELHFKFRTNARPGSRRDVIEKLSRLGVRSVKPLFPGEKDDELAALYSLQCSDSSTTRVLDRLHRESSVEFAEPVLRRKLIR